ncbi:MAG: hypothetical protein D6722_22325 [Bacteroidetes bacterium]|nr:MAG: hypothetical protein D6722_22325 [Bacteroidota bacterium]
MLQECKEKAGFIRFFPAFSGFFPYTYHYLRGRRYAFFGQLRRQIAQQITSLSGALLRHFSPAYSLPFL